MARSWPIVNDRTTQLHGDPHIGRMLRARAKTLQTSIAREAFTPAARLSSGDRTNKSQNGEHDEADVLLNYQPGTVESDLIEVPGNHDILTTPVTVAPDPSDYTNSYGKDGVVADWSVRTGKPYFYAVDIGYMEWVVAGWQPGWGQRLSPEAMAFIASRADNTIGPRRLGLAIHPMIYNTAVGPEFGRRFIYTSTRDGFYINGPTGDNSEEILDLLASYPGRFTTVATGHGHIPTCCPGLVTEMTLGGEKIAVVNASGLVWDFNKDQANAPLRTINIRDADDAIHVTCFDHRLGNYVPFTSGVRERIIEL